MKLRTRISAIFTIALTVCIVIVITGLTFVLDGPDGVEVVTGVDVVAVRAALEAER